MGAGADPKLIDQPALVVVTGAGGWLGRELVAALARGDAPLGRPQQVRALLLSENEGPVLPDSELVERVVGDVTQPQTLAPLFAGAAGAVVIHTAAVIHPSRTEQFESVNVVGARNVIAAARAAGVRRLVHVSSNSPFGFNPTPADAFRADDPYNPYLGYGRSKMLGEIAALEANDGGAETVVVRPPWFYGPGQPERQTSFFKLVRRGLFPSLGSGRNRRSMAYVGNLVDGLLRAALVEQAAGRAYWVADAEPYEMRRVIAAVQAGLEGAGLSVTRSRMRLPAITGDLAGALDTALQARGRYNQQLHVLSELHRTIACDIGRAERELGYRPRIAVEEGMALSIRWCLEQGIAL